MEDCSLLVADGAVLCCCCPCLILQILVFVLLKLPCKLAGKSRKLVRRRLALRLARKRGKQKAGRTEVVVREAGQIIIQGQLTRILSGGVSVSRKNTMNAVEKALEKFSEEGQFGFGSFWGGDGSSSFPPDVSKGEFDVVHYSQFIDLMKNL